MLLSVLGLTVELCFDASVGGPDRQALIRSWRRCEVRGVPAELTYVLSIGRDGTRRRDDTGVRHISAPSAAEMRSALTSRLTLDGIEQAKHSRRLFHAVGLADERGRVAVCAASSGTGKTTVARVLGHRFGYVSDETVAIDRGGRIVPYPKPLSVIVEPERPKAQIGPDELGLSRPAVALRAAALICLERDPLHSGAPVTETLDLLDAMTELIPQISYLAAWQAPLQELAQLIDQMGGAHHIRYAEASSLVTVIDEILRSPTPKSPFRWEPALEPACQPPVELGKEQSERRIYSRSAQVQDAILYEEHVLVFGDAQLKVLEGIGAAIWKALERPLGEARLLDAVSSLLGPAPQGVDGRDLCLAAVTQLQESGIISVMAQSSSGTRLPAGDV